MTTGRQDEGDNILGRKMLKMQGMEVIRLLHELLAARMRHFGRVTKRAISEAPALDYD